MDIFSTSVLILFSQNPTTRNRIGWWPYWRSYPSSTWWAKTGRRVAQGQGVCIFFPLLHPVKPPWDVSALEIKLTYFIDGKSLRRRHLRGNGVILRGSSITTKHGIRDCGLYMYNIVYMAQERNGHDEIAMAIMDWPRCKLAIKKKKKISQRLRLHLIY